MLRYIMSQMQVATLLLQQVTEPEAEKCGAKPKLNCHEGIWQSGKLQH